MASELTFTEQRERRRMAHVLHDHLQQLLVAAKIRIESLEGIDPNKRQEEIESLVGLIDESLANSRSLAIELSPPVLSEGLGRALEWLCGTWMKDKYQLKVTCLIDTAIDTREDDMRSLVFLAVKELLFNVVKHSGIREARVELAEEDADTLRVVVSDRGFGFDSKGASENPGSGSGLGLIGLHERLEMLGGSFRIHSTRGSGVEARILAPKASSQPLPP